MQYTIFDIETNGLYDNATKIHCLSYQKFNNGVLTEKNSITNYETIKNFIQTQSILVGHNIIRYDLPVLHKLLGVVVPKETKIIDTLGLSWYLYESRKSHGLEEWGEDLGVEKPKIDDWSNLTIEEYIHRCSEDVEINQLLFHKQLELLTKLYNQDYWRIIHYLNFKLRCLLIQEFTKCKINVDLLNKSLDELTKLAESKIEILKSVMPKNITYKTISKPSKIYKKDGSLSSAGEKWFNLLLSERLPEDYEGEVSIISKVEEGNPASISQLKSWLFSLGWKPDVYAEVKDKKKGTVRQVEQIFNDKKLLTDSVKELISVCPELEELNQLSLINHRIGIFKSFKDCLDENNYVIATAGGLTSTLRLKHRKPISNLPKINTFYGENIRGLITIPSENYTLCGSDMCALEDTTKQHYMYYFDPEYVKEMRTPGFDPHIEIAVFANLMTRDEANEFKRLKKLDNPTEEEHKKFIELNSKRNKAKTTNFASVYNVGAKTLSKTLKISVEEAQQLLDAYWTKNKSVKQATEYFKIKVLFKDGTQQVYLAKDLLSMSYQQQNVFNSNVESTWIFNPISKFWYSLRVLKDCFSAVNQSSGVYCFDNYLMEGSKYFNFLLTYHDESLYIFDNKKYTEEEVTKILKDCIKRVNDKVKLNVPLDIDTIYGTNYAQCH